MLAGFLMHQYLIGARIDEYRCVFIRIGDHQVDVEREPRHFTDAGDYRRSDGEVLDEVAVHHVEMQHAGPTSLDLRDLLAQTCEIRGQDGGENFDHGKSDRFYHGPVGQASRPVQGRAWLAEERAYEARAGYQPGS